jgi:excisionase family DNA binding protein
MRAEVDGDEIAPATLLSLRELAQRWGVDVKTLRGMIDRGELPVVRLGRLIRVPVAVIRSIESQGSAAPAGSHLCR